MSKESENLEIYCVKCGEWVVLSPIENDTWKKHYIGSCLFCGSSMRMFPEGIVADKNTLIFDLD